MNPLPPSKGAGLHVPPDDHSFGSVLPLTAAAAMGLSEKSARAIPPDDLAEAFAAKAKRKSYGKWDDGKPPIRHPRER